jgi:hypothetical protein
MFTIDSVNDNGKFSGHAELLDGLYKGDRFDFSGKLYDDGAITLKRRNCDQVSRAEAPEFPGFHNVWRGKTYIAETKARLIFELRIRKESPAEAKATPVERAVGKLKSVPGEAMKSVFTPIDISSQANFSWSGTIIPGVGVDLPGAPVGNVTLSGVPFSIKSNRSDNQAWSAGIASGGSTGESGSAQRQTITVEANVYGARHVFTLINCWHGQRGPRCYAWLTFRGSAGASYTKKLVGDIDIRDYNEGGHANRINNTTTTMVYSAQPLYKTPKRLDMQDITLPPEFATQTLTTITLVDNGRPSFQRTVLGGITVESAPALAAEKELHFGGQPGSYLSIPDMDMKRLTAISVVGVTPCCAATAR